MSYRSYIPVAIFLLAAILTANAAAQEPNLTYYYDPNLTYPLTPTTTYPGSFPVILPATLPGNSMSTYLNVSGKNDGAVGTISDCDVALKVDGAVVKYLIWGPIGAGVIYRATDVGPINVRGGRHILEVFHDDLELIAEYDETDNIWGHQFVFTPYVLSESTPKTRGAPPEHDAGWTSIVDGSTFTDNCDGFRFTSTGWWNAITVYTKDGTGYYPIYLYNPSTGSEDGFYSYIDQSATLEGWLDAIFINRNVVGINDYDIGVENLNQSDDQFVIEQIVSQSAWVGSSMTVDLGTDDYLRIWDVYVGPDDLGWVTVFVQDTELDGQDFYVGWLDNTTTTSSVTSFPEWTITDDLGRVRIHKDLTTSDYYGLVLFRNSHDGRGPQTLQVSIEPTPADLLPLHMPGWHAEVVPTPTPFVGPVPVVLPDTLHGYMPATYLNYSLENYGPVGTPPVEVAIKLDGVDDRAFPSQTPTMPPFSAWSGYGTVAQEIPGGRHTLTVSLDYTESIHEIYEDNNFLSKQYCWSPMELSLGVPFSHEAPGNSTGGFEYLPPFDPIYANCDGYRFYTGYCEWEGVVLTSGPNSDCDLTLHDPLIGTQNGFGNGLALSNFLTGEIDYILLNNNLLPAGVYDVGVQNWGGDEPYTVEATGSTNLPIPINGTHGPFGIPAAKMLNIHNIYLEQDLYAFRLDNLAGFVDWGIALHPHDMGLQGRLALVPAGWSWMNGPGMAEWFTVDIGTAGFYGLAVFKISSTEVDKAGTYELTILQGVSDVEDSTDLPPATALAGVHPNPFNPQTTISYELAVAAEVELDIYDVKGALVRRLVREAMPAGRHAVVWNGQDDSGARVASGVYLARFSAGAYRDFTKLVMVK